MLKHGENDAAWRACSLQPYRLDLGLERSCGLVAAEVDAGYAVVPREAVGVQSHLHPRNEVVRPQRRGEVVRHLCPRSITSPSSIP